MRNVFLTYQVELLVKGPVFVGSVKEISKKEYMFLNADTIGILAGDKLYSAMRRMGKTRQFEDFLLNRGRMDLDTWLRQERIKPLDLKNCVRYELKCKELIEARRDRSKLQIMECIKDPYGKPYIPGTSIKGMLRTILLSHDIMNDGRRYANEKQMVTATLFGWSKSNRNTLLKREIGSMEAKSFRTLKRESTKPNDAVNDVMQGFVVSDSEPLVLSDLTLCQAMELHVDGDEKPLPIMRETIKPGTKIRFSITIDTTVCPYDREGIEIAIRNFADQFNQNFGKKFSHVDNLQDNQVLLGGGAGFSSKTIVYPLYGYREGVKVTKAVFDKTGVPRIHKHDLDLKLGVSPHIMKCARYQGKLCKMGLCEVRFL